MTRKKQIDNLRSAILGRFSELIIETELLSPSDTKKAFRSELCSFIRNYKYKL